MKVKEYFVFSVQSVCAFNEKQTIKTAGLSLKLKFQSYSKDTFDRFLLSYLFIVYTVVEIMNFSKQSSGLV